MSRTGNYDNGLRDLFAIFEKCFFWQGTQKEKDEYIKSFELTESENECLQALSNVVFRVVDYPIPVYKSGTPRMSGTAKVGDMGERELIINNPSSYYVTHGTIPPDAKVNITLAHPSILKDLGFKTYDERGAPHSEELKAAFDALNNYFTAQEQVKKQ